MLVFSTEILDFLYLFYSALNMFPRIVCKMPCLLDQHAFLEELRGDIFKYNFIICMWIKEQLYWEI